jgi:hypothetical protein
MSHPQVVWEDEFASLTARYALSIVTARMHIGCRYHPLVAVLASFHCLCHPGSSGVTLASVQFLSCKLVSAFGPPDADTN